MPFHLSVDYRPRGDQATAIESLVRGVKDGEQHQVLLGVTGSGKTFTMAKVIEQTGRPALVLAHNKTLAAQLYQEFKIVLSRPTRSSISSATTITISRKLTFPPGDVYIEKEATINDELDKLRLSATQSLFERRDCVIVASVSCIYGLGSPEAYYGMLLMLEKGQKIAREEITSRLVDILYERQRRRFPARHVSRARRRDRDVSDLRRQSRIASACGAMRSRSLEQIDPLTGQVKQTYLRLPDLSEDALRDDAGDARTAPAEHRERAALVERRARKAGQADRGAAAVAAHHVRSRDDPADRILPRDRELFAAFFGTAAGAGAADAAGLSAARSR